MFKFLTKAISNALGFSKAEARGTLLLIFIILTSIVFSRIYVVFLKNPTPTHVSDKAMLEEWVAEVESSYHIRPETDNSVYLATSNFNTERKKYKRSLIAKGQVEMTQNLLIRNPL